MSCRNRCAHKRVFSRVRSFVGSLAGALDLASGNRGIRRCQKPARCRPALEALESLILPNAVVATGAGSGSKPIVRVYDAATGQLTREFMAYDPTFTGGVNVATADL